MGGAPRFHAASSWPAYEKLETPGIRGWKLPHTPILDEVTARIQGRPYTRAREAGRAMTLEQAMRYALEEWA